MAQPARAQVGRPLSRVAIPAEFIAPITRDGFCLRKLMTVVHAAQFGLIGDVNSGFTSVRPRQLHHVGQVELAFGVLVIIFQRVVAHSRR
jgi:hypothetical protein